MFEKLLKLRNEDIDTVLDTAPGSDWLFYFGSGGFLLMTLGAVKKDAEELDFSQIVCLMPYCQHRVSFSKYEV